ncbi:ankyrin repeat-containing domain protein [Rhexocercosporidium sp. MPI-PUGE-AT-0058]|nr:ankyrin repeat-containing domain protein [Rhexocercosporidium sp. MPI-PUGE-AT-0058]
MSGIEVIGLLASITSLAEASKKLFTFAENVYKADEQRLDVLQQLSCLDAVSTAIERLKEQDPNGTWIEELDPSDPTSPAGGLMVAVGKMEILLQMNGDRMEKFKWHWNKKKLDPLFREINQYCTSLLVILGWAQAEISAKIRLITRTTAENIDKMRELMEQDRRKRDEQGVSMMKIAETVKNLEISDKARHTEQEKAYRKDVERWLSTLEFQARQQTILRNVNSSQGNSIGQWFFESDEFKYWKEGKIKLLKGLGAPGAGKTVLSSVIVDKLIRDSGEVPVLCVFLEKAEASKQTPDDIRGSLLKQLIQFRESGLSPAIRKAFDKATRMNTAPDDNQTRGLLKAEIEFYSQVYVIVDALDEASDEARCFIEEELREIHQQKLSILTMSRTDNPDTLKCIRCNICRSECVRYHQCIDCEECDTCDEQRFDCLTICVSCFDGGNRCPHGPTHKLQETTPDEHEIKISTPDSDIERYVHESVRADMPKKLSKTNLGRNVGRNELARRCAESPDLLDQVQNFITEKSGGRFLLAREYVKSFKKKHTLGDIKRMLKAKGSADLSPLYDEDMVWIMKQERGDLARRVFSLVYHAKRNLTLLELQQALATGNGDLEHDPDDITHEADILSATKGLIGIDRLETMDKDVDVMVRFDHLTRREYFDSNWQSWFGTGQVDLANKCLTFLNFEVFAKPDASEEDFKSKEKSLPFISYAVQFWGDHVRDVGSNSTEIMGKAVQYLKDPSRVDAYIKAAWAANTRHKDKWDVRRSIHPLHICGWFDLEHLIPALGCKAIDIDVEETTHQQTPLMYACRRGNVETVRELLKLGADVNKQSRKGRTPLFEAILRLQKVPTSPDLCVETETLNRVFNSQRDIEKSEQIVKLLLSFGKGANNINLNIQNPKMLQRTALLASIAYRQTSIALEILNQADLDVNKADIEGTTALCLSACYGMAEVVSRLLQFPSVDLDRVEKGAQRTALLLAARSSPNPQVVDLLLRKGANQNKLDSHGSNPIFRSLQADNDEIFLAFVKNSSLTIDLTSTDKDGRSLMHWAAEAGKSYAIYELHAKGLSVDSRDNLDMTPLHDACRCGERTAVEQLIEFGADRSAKDKLGRIPATIALQYGHTDVENICKIEGEAEPNAVDLPAWSLAITRKFDAITRLIALDPFSLNIKEPRTERSALHCLLRWNEKDEEENVQMKIMRKLIHEGNMPPDEADRYGQTPLHLAAIHGNLEATKLLLDCDVRVDALDVFGLTPLLIAYKNQDLSVATALIEEGATIDDNRMNLEELLFAALKLENETAVRYLIAAGADRMAMDNDGRTADMIAEQSKDKRLVKIMKEARSTRIKAPTKNMSTKFVVSELRDAIEEVDEILEVAHSEVLYNGVPARGMGHTPFSARNFDFGNEGEYNLV